MSKLIVISYLTESYITVCIFLNCSNVIYHEIVIFAGNLTKKLIKNEVTI